MLRSTEWQQQKQRIQWNFSKKKYYILILGDNRTKKFPIQRRFSQTYRSDSFVDNNTSITETLRKYYIELIGEYRNNWITHKIKLTESFTILSDNMSDF